MGLNHAIKEDLLEKNYMYRKLLTEHDELKMQISKLSNAPATSDHRISKLKKLKLCIADKMTILELQ